MYFTQNNKQSRLHESLYKFIQAWNNRMNGTAAPRLWIGTLKIQNFIYIQQQNKQNSTEKFNVLKFSNYMKHNSMKC